MIVAFETGRGEGFNLMRQALVRVVLAVQHAALSRPSPSPHGGNVLRLALAPISRTPHVGPDGHPPDGLRWSQLIDIDHLSAGTGLQIADLDDVIRDDPTMTWRLLHLSRPRHQAVPASGNDHRLPHEPSPDSSGAPDDPAAAVCRCRPPGWLRWGSVQRVDASCTPDTSWLTAEILGHAGFDTPGLFLTPAQQITWGRFYGSAEFWRVVQGLRPAQHLRRLAERHRPEGPYLAVHWRRGDFTMVHPEVSPSPEAAAGQITGLAAVHGLSHVFVATDADEAEISALRGAVSAQGLRCETLPRSVTPDLADLEHSLVEQTILFTSDAFVGTRHSMFTTTVFETREAAGSPPNATWNVLYGDADHPGAADDDEHGPIAPRHPYR